MDETFEKKTLSLTKNEKQKKEISLKLTTKFEQL